MRPTGGSGDPRGGFARLHSCCGVGISDGKEDDLHLCSWTKHCFLCPGEESNEAVKASTPPPALPPAPTPTLAVLAKQQDAGSAVLIPLNQEKS